ncbi:MarR family transcriptional regulator [Streptomyces sp. ERV7]|uniref:MarR family winged helix-turn-helix transcriptional regulator n=1 Tax=Streptomyces sp. ERV7 TaxID=1322334 RepID=UPI0007F45224|nr:MarR family transcriptional regulator [Streptomyces sp. ERV7]OAR27308.1 MarR family transcriptional regulator [Streptomyces sp. ERV7]
MIIDDDAALQLVVSLHRLLRSLRRAAPADGIQPTQIVLLSLLAESGPARIGALAARVPCSQPTATAAVSGLEATGLVRRESDPTDGRAARIVLTDRGARALVDAARAEAEVLAWRLGALGAEEARAVVALGPLLRRLAEAAHDGSDPASRA